MIKAKAKDFGTYEVEVKDKEEIIDMIYERIVFQVSQAIARGVAEEILNSYIDLLKGDATVYQYNCLMRYPKVLKFLEDITVFVT
jgi:hypothetical protein